MLGHIRRHQKWLWVLIAGATIISFVIFLDPTTGRRGGGRSIFGGRTGDYGSINGRAISPEEFGQMKQEAKLEYLFSAGRWPGEDEAARQFFDLDRRTLERIFLIEKVQDLNIQVGDEAAADWIASNPNFRDRDGGAFHLELFQKFLKQVLPQGRITEDEFQQFVRHEAGIEHLFALGGLSGGLVAPREAEALYRQENEQLATEVVLFPASNYLAGVEVTPAALGQFYTNNMAQYRVHERVQVGYVKFEITNFLAEADQLLAQETNLTALLEQAYKQRGPDFFKDADGKTMSHDAAIQKMRADERESAAVTAARKKATEFMEQLYELYQKQPKQSDNLEKLAAATGYQSALSEPFTQQDGPKDLKVLETFTQTAFALTPDQPMPSDPIKGEDAVYVIALKKKIPSEMQPLEAVRERVVADFRRREATEAARKAGRAFYNTLTNGLAQKKSFQAVCLEANVISQKPPLFSLSTRSLPQEWDGRVDLSMLKDAASSLSPGETSPFEMTRDGRLGQVVYLLSRQPVDGAVLKAELPAFTARLRAERQREALSEWLHKEFGLAHMTGGPLQKKSGAP